MGRKILFVTTDQQRYDALGCNGGAVARTPVVDALAASGVRFERAHPQSVVCMPSRATMLTGQHVSTHGVWMNGVPLPIDAPSVAERLWVAGYRTALVGKAHFEPFLDPFGRFTENRLGREGAFTAHHPDADGRPVPHRGFEHLEFATHTANGPLHYSQWLQREHPEAVVSISSQVLREYREYERSMTTLVDAAVKPNVSRYVRNISSRLRELWEPGERS